MASISIPKSPWHALKSMTVFNVHISISILNGPLSSAWKASPPSLLQTSSKSYQSHGQAHHSNSPLFALCLSDFSSLWLRWPGEGRVYILLTVRGRAQQRVSNGSDWWPERGAHLWSESGEDKCWSSVCLCLCSVWDLNPWDRGTHTEECLPSSVKYKMSLQTSQHSIS